MIQRPSGASRGRHGPSILLVEDDAGHAGLVRRAFQDYSQPFHLRIASTLAEARRQVEQSLPDLVIADLILPDGRGLDCLPQDRSLYPLLLITSHGDEEVAVNALKAGVQDYLVKSQGTLLEMPRLVERALRDWRNEMKRRLVERELRNLKALLVSAFSQTPAGMVIVDAPDQAVRFSNPTALAILGESHQSHPDSWPLFHPDGSYWEPAERPLARALFQAEPSVNVEAIVRVAGQDRWILGNAAPVLDENENVTAAVFVFPEITDMKSGEAERARLRDQLLHAQKLETVGTLAGGLAHDFNNILQAVLGFSEIALSEPQLSDAVQGYLERIMGAADRGKAVIQQVLTFSRQMEQHRKPVQLVPIVSEALDLLRASIPTTIEIRRDLNPECGQVRADPTQLHQVVMNLCTNAYQAMRGTGGTLSVSLNPTSTWGDELGSNHPGLVSSRSIRLRIEDTGEGIPPEILERIFEPFFTTKEIGEGTGLGLAVVHGIVTSHGGEIVARSEPGVSTVFEVFLPECDDATRPSQESASLPAGGFERILFVDDEANIVEVARKMLTHLGYRVETASGSLEALQVFSGRPSDFDVVITDHTMPEMTGLQLARKLVAIRSDIPVIITTGGRLSEHQTPEGLSDIAGFVPKPYRTEDLGRKLRAVLDAANPGNPTGAGSI